MTVPSARSPARSSPTDVETLGSASSPSFASIKTVVICAVVIGILAWGSWASHTLMEVRDREIVTVRLSELMADFIEVESRRGGDPEAARARTADYVAAVDRAVAGLAGEGTTVLVAEAVVSGTAPDHTGRVRARIAADLESGVR